MTFSKLLKMTEEGQVLDERQVRILAYKLNLAPSPIRLAWQFTLVVLGTVLVFLAFIYNTKYFFLNWFFVVLLFAFDIFIFCYKGNKKNIIAYLEAIRKYYLNKFKDFEGFEMCLLQHEYQRSGFLQNNLCIFLTNGYEYYIFDDLLKSTNYYLPRCFKGVNNKQPVLKVFDRYFVDKKPVYFKSSEIAFFQLSKPFNPVREEENLSLEYRQFTYLIDKRELDESCWLELQDRSVFKLSLDASMVLRRRAKGKERE